MLKALRRIFAPAFIIGPRSNPYLLRWRLFPRTFWLGNVYLHKFLRDDDDRALHDHPWWSVSFIVWGRYREIDKSGARIVSAPSFRWRRPEYAHRIELPDGKPCWTIMLVSPRVREWGFHCPWGWRPWFEFTSDDGSETGRGCD